MKIIRVVKREEEEWRVKSKQLWLKASVNKTKYFHKHTKAWLCKNVIKELKHGNGQKVEGQDALKDNTFHRFCSLYFDNGETELEAQANFYSSIPNIIS